MNLIRWKNCLHGNDFFTVKRKPHDMPKHKKLLRCALAGWCTAQFHRRLADAINLLIDPELSLPTRIV